MLELLLCSLLTVLPDYLYRRYAQGKRIGHEITLFSVWYELRWGITLCLLLTVALITTIFYFHPSTKFAVAVFRTVPVLPETSGRVAETFVDINQRVAAGDKLFRLDSSAQEAVVESARRRIAEVEAAITTAQSQLKEADGRIAQARGMLQQAIDESEARADVQRRSPGSVAGRDVQRAQVAVDTQQGALDAALASRESILSRLEFELPAQKATAESQLVEAEVGLEKTLVVAGTDGIVQQFALRPGDVVNPMLRPAGVLVPARKHVVLTAGFGQIESQVVRPGLVGEVACAALPWQVVPVVVTEVQNVIASGQIKPTDVLVDMKQLSQPGTITAFLEPIYEGQLDRLPQGGNCFANVYTSHHEELQNPSIGFLKRFGLHAIDTVGIVHAMILRMQSLLLPVQTLVLSGH